MSHNPLEIEKIFSSDVEPIYNLIIADLSREEDVSIETRINLMNWVYFNKFRNLEFRENMELFLENLTRIYGNYSGNPHLDELYSPYNIKNAKALQFNTLVNKEIFTNFTTSMEKSQWRILKSHPTSPFITNDNPGFSVKVNEKAVNYLSLNSFYTFSANYHNLYIISPKYCLHITSFSKDRTLESDIYNFQIVFEQIEPDDVD